MGLMSVSGTAGIVLCGGRSSRMGRPKAWLPIGGETMLGRLVRVLSGTVSRVVVSAAAGQSLPPLPESVGVVVDAVPEHGPLGGIASAMAVLTEELVFIAACDLARLGESTIRELLCLLAESDHDAVVPRVAGRPQPLAAAYRRRVLPRIAQQLDRGERALHTLLEVLAVHFADRPAGEFANINTPEEYEVLLG